MKWYLFVSVMVAMVLAFGAAAQAEVITHGGTTINMDFVTIGNAGNGNDTHGAGYGGVGYNYRIGKYEVTVDQWDAVIAADPRVGDDGDWNGSQPTGGAGWNEAAKFCNWLTTGDANRGYYTIYSGMAIPKAMSHNDYAAVYGTTYFIPSENEWYKAAYHKNNGVTGGASNYWDYPTGSDNVPVGIRSPQVPAFDAVFDDGFHQDHPNDVTNAGVLSPYGTIAQGGNVFEWTEGLYSGNESQFEGWRQNRGGSGINWCDATTLLASVSYYTDPTNHLSTVGFRVSSVPEPASITLMLCGALGGLLCWYRKRKQ